MDKNENFDERLDEADVAFLQELAEQEKWTIRNNHTQKESIDFYMGALTAYNNILSLMETHPKASEPEFVKFICNQLSLDTAVILKNKPRIILPNKSIIL